MYKAKSNLASRVGLWTFYQHPPGNLEVVKPRLLSHYPTAATGVLQSGISITNNAIMSILRDFISNMYEVVCNLGTSFEPHEATGDKL